MKVIEKLFEKYTSEKIEEIVELPSSGSNRRYFRIKSNSHILIGTLGSCVEENVAFYTLAEHFRNKGIKVPKVYAHNDDFTCYLQEDLGENNLFNVIAPGRSKGSYNKQEVELLKKTVAALPAIQFEGSQGLDFSVCYPQPEFDERMISFDLNYFKYCFLKATGLEFSEIKLDEDFKKLSRVLIQANSDSFMCRDFQARNVMLVNNEPYFIDFQGGRKGPFYYDVASFIWQAKANYSLELKEELIDIYLESLKKHINIDENVFQSQLRHFVLFRTLQVLGAYGFRGYFEKKPHFLQSVPFAMDNLKHLLKVPFEEYPYLSELLRTLSNMEQYAHTTEDKKLEIRIFSFAYKKGIPNDNSGNGGGYVFDCRSINNPGKYDHYKHFTGMDQQVIDFLEDDGGVYKFLDNVYSLAEVHVKRYIERKFTNLMFCFGCTGGQHRSVYCAENLAKYLAKRFNVKIILTHREQGVEKEL